MLTGWRATSIGEGSKFERARIDRARSNLFRGVSAGRGWNAFLIPADCGGCYSIEENAISSVWGEEGGREGGKSNFSLTRGKYAAVRFSAWSRTRRRCYWKSANWREDCLIYVTHILRVCWVYLGTSTRLKDLFFDSQHGLKKANTVILNWKKDQTRVFLMLTLWEHWLRKEQKNKITTCLCNVYNICVMTWLLI